MNTEIKNFILYGKLIVQKWILWVFITIDITAVIAQIIFPSFKIPQLLFIVSAIIGLFWAGYQVNHDISPNYFSQHKELPPFEILPLSFEVALNRNIPCIEIYIYFVNYFSKEIFLQSIEITDFRISGIQQIENIIKTIDYPISPKSSSQIMCHRNLIDAETHLFDSISTYTNQHATFGVKAVSKLGSKTVRYNNPSISINGSISAKYKEVQAQPPAVGELTKARRNNNNIRGNIPAKKEITKRKRPSV
jgi:hypothetical protein